ncbi:allergen Tha p 1 [Spodoptera frugiperda]|uniref:Allergen Tha p 1 n=2 Tax=Obtectomera TaxID=104431 RepID=A0A8F6T7Y0_SPOFR|nr:allergen Tha p 1 [Spodoptera frugiperda]QXT24551.1 chemosensory protein 5 [Spodoptera frugiperda]WPO56437.1 chemosensory protein [Leucinodes orbonalis]
MKVVFLVCVLAAVVYGEQYTDKYDNIDLDEILHNEKILQSYVNCCLDQGKCTPDGKELKSHIKEALENRCAKCTDAQKRGTEKVLKFLINHKPDIWDQLCNKFDPEGLYRKKYEQEYQSAKQ